MPWTKDENDERGETTIPKAPSIHVVPRDRDWIVRSAHSKRAIAAYNTQEEAIARARRLAAQAFTDVVVHGADGRIRDTISERRLDDGPHYHVTPREAEWVVAREGEVGAPADQPRGVFETKLAAVDAARDMARNHQGVLYIHASDGSVEQVYHFSEVPAQQ